MKDNLKDRVFKTLKLEGRFESAKAVTHLTAVYIDELVSKHLRWQLEIG